MIVVLDRHAPLRTRPTIALSARGSRSVMLGLAPTPSRVIDSAWPKWLLSFENTNLSVARSSHRRSRRSE
jgi:hypothetical protein